MKRLFHQGRRTESASLLLKVEQLNRLQADLMPHLEERSQSHVRVANFREGTLILAVDSAAWASQLRYLLPNLCKALSKEARWSTLKKIELTIAPPYHDTTRTQAKTIRKIAHQAAESLRSTAKHLQHEDLQQALLNLAKHADRGY